MSVHRSSRFRIAAAASVLAALTGLTLGATTILGLTFQGSDENPQGQATRQEGLLLTANRDRLAICVQVVLPPGAINTGLIQVDAKSRVEELLPEIAKHRHWERAGLAVAEPVVDIGCPSDPALLRSGANVRDGAAAVPGSAVPEASQYKVFVFIMAQAEIDRLFAGWPYRRVPQEILCEGHQCGEVTTGVYLSFQELKSRSFLKDALVKGIGLEPDVPYDASSLATPSPSPFPRYVRICVQAIGLDSATEATAVKDIEAALAGEAKYPYWEWAGFAVAPPVVDAGCPSEPLPSRSGVAWEEGIPLGPFGREGDVAQESYYELFVFMMPLPEIERLLGGLSKRRAPQEFECGGDVCHEVTTALYVSPEEVANRNFLADSLLDALGFDPDKLGRD